MKDEMIITVYCMRHQQSVQNKRGYGEKDTELTDEGRENAGDLAALIEKIGFDKIPFILSSDLKRTKETAEILKGRSNYKGEIIMDERLRAIFSGPLLERPAEETEKEHNLARFKADDNGRCEVKLSNDSIISFNPKINGIYPYDPLYCAAFYDKTLRKIVFPNEKTLASFKNIEKTVISLQSHFIDLAKKTDKPLYIPVVGSCSIYGFNLEYSAYGTIGENMFIPFGTEKKPIFPQDHGQVMVLGYTEQDLKKGRRLLRAVEGNVEIGNYINGLVVQK